MIQKIAKKSAKRSIKWYMSSNEKGGVLVRTSTQVERCMCSVKCCCCLLIIRYTERAGPDRTRWFEPSSRTQRRPGASSLEWWRSPEERKRKYIVSPLLGAFFIDQVQANKNGDSSLNNYFRSSYLSVSRVGIRTVDGACIPRGRGRASTGSDCADTPPFRVVDLTVQRVPKARMRLAHFHVHLGVGLTTRRKLQQKTHKSFNV